MAENWIKIKADPYIAAYLKIMTEELGYIDDSAAIENAILTLDSIVSSANNNFVKKHVQCCGMINFNYLRDTTNIVPVDPKSLSMQFLLKDNYITRLNNISKAYMEYFNYKHCNTKIILRCALKYTIIERRHIMCYRFN